MSAAPESDSTGTAPGGRGTLDREVIITAALALIDRDGLPGLTMRKLGAALQVDAMSIYGYFANKAALVDAIVQHEADRLAAYPGPYPDDLIELMVSLALHLRSVLLEHPNLAMVVASRPVSTAETLSNLHFSVRLLQAAGFADDDIPTVAQAMVGFSLGYVVQEATWATSRREMGSEFDDSSAALRAQLEQSPTAVGPERTIIERWLSLERDSTPFEMGLRALLEGFRSGAGQRRTSS